MAFETSVQGAVETEIIETIEGDGEAALSNDGLDRSILRRQTRNAVISPNAALERFFKVVTSCLENDAKKPNTASNS